MIRERIITFLDLVVNSVITFLCIYAGLVFGSYTIIVSGYYTVLDMFEDSISFFTGLVRGRRANKKCILGFGKKELSIQMLIGMVIFTIGVFVLIKDFFLKYNHLDIRLLFILIGLSVVKYLFANFEFRNAKSIQSSMLMNLAHDNFYAGLIFIAIIFFAYMGVIIPVFDLLGTIFLGIIIILKGLLSILESMILLNGENKQNKKVIADIKKSCKKCDVEFLYADIISVEEFYKVNLEILVNDDIRLLDLIILEIDLKCKIKLANKKVKLISIDCLKSEDKKNEE